MKKMVLYYTVAVMAASCTSPSPKETAQQFIEALYTSDITTAASLSSSETKALTENIRPTNNSLSPEEAFQLTTFSEIISGDKAEVKNNVITLAMVKEKGEWKIVANEKMLTGIREREKLLSDVKVKWEGLLKEYEGRITIAKEYIAYKENSGALSPQAKALKDLLQNISPEKEWTKEKLLAYLQKQQALKTAIDNALEPSLAAHADLTMNYFIQISNAGDRIKQAEAAYQPIAQNAASPVYVTLPFAAVNTVNVKKG